MTEIGEGISVNSSSEQDVDDLFLLRFKLLDENGLPIKNVPYKTVEAGASAEPLHIADGETTQSGITEIVSRTQDEEIDFYIVWAKLTINKGFFKM